MCCVSDGAGRGRSEVHLPQLPARLQLMKHKLKADVEQWGPAAQLKAIAQRLYNGAGSRSALVTGKVSTAASPTNPLPFLYPENQASTDF